MSDRYRYLLRMPVELRDKVTGSAKRNARSFNSEVLSKNVLYVATDFGVVKGSNDGKGSWTGPPGMPRLEVTHLEIQPSSRVPTCVGAATCPSLMYAATHSQGFWLHKLAGGQK